MRFVFILHQDIKSSNKIDCRAKIRVFNAIKLGNCCNFLPKKTGSYTHCGCQLGSLPLVLSKKEIVWDNVLIVIMLE